MNTQRYLTILIHGVQDKTSQLRSSGSIVQEIWIVVLVYRELQDPRWCDQHSPDVAVVHLRLEGGWPPWLRVLITIHPLVHALHSIVIHIDHILKIIIPVDDELQ